MLKSIYFYFVTINVFVFIMMVLDKWYAVKGKWRIPENILLGSAILGGGVGLVTAMVISRHKLSKWRFRIIGPLNILFVFVLMGYFIFYRPDFMLL